MHRLAWVIVGLASLPATSASAQSKLEDAVAFIRVGVTDPTTKARRELTQGTGFLIDKLGHIVTARHVILFQELENPGPRWTLVSLRDRNGTPIPAQLVSCESGVIDLCLIKIPDASVAAANITTTFAPTCRTLVAREPVEAMGYPSGSDNPVLTVSGKVTGGLATELKYPADVQIAPGMSGGPVVDMNGKVVAANAGSAEGLPTLIFLQPLLYSEGLIKRTGVACPNVPTANIGPPANAGGEPQAAQHPDPITPLMHPKRLEVAAAAADANMRIVRIIEGQSGNPQRRIFDVLVENRGDSQLVLDTWELEWQYLQGVLSGSEPGQTLIPNTRYSLDLRIDPSDPAIKRESIPVEPAVMLPAGSAKSPSLFPLRLEITYTFVEGMAWHPTADWDLKFSVSLRTLTGEVLPIFINTHWSS